MVNYIKARRIVKGGGVEYLVHWQGYEDKDDTWEPLSNLSGMEPDLSAFESKEKKDMEDWAKAKAEAIAAKAAKAAADKAAAALPGAGAGNDSDEDATAAAAGSIGLVCGRHRGPI